MDFSARLAGLKILALFEDTGLGFLARAELRPGLNSSPCNQQFDFKRICFRSRAEILAQSGGQKFQPGDEIRHVHVVRPLERGRFYGRLSLCSVLHPATNFLVSVSLFQQSTWRRC